MLIKRELVKVHTPPGHPGFLGAGHIARSVIQIDFPESDPFILLMDDMLDKKDDSPAGGPHPHAGFETVSLLLEGEMGEPPHMMKAGDFEMMTAGHGVVHTETIDKRTSIRLLQLWLNLPKKDRWIRPRVQRLKAVDVPTLSENGVTIRLYSGSFAGLVSPIQNYTPLILAETRIAPGVSATYALPARFNTFLYVIEGSVKVGEGEKLLSHDQVGWLDRVDVDGPGELKLIAGSEGVRFVMYAAMPQQDDIVVNGPFVADTVEEIKQLYAQYRQGKMKHISIFEEQLKR